VPDVCHLPLRLKVRMYVLSEPLLETLLIEVSHGCLEKPLPSNPVCCGQHLATLEDHLADVLITVVLSSTNRIFV
jgi:hypothetical protein